MMPINDKMTGIKNPRETARVPLLVRWYYNNLYFFPVLGIFLGLLLATTFLDCKLTRGLEGANRARDVEWDGRTLLLSLIHI